MSFLDNLENTLKNLESRDEAAGNDRHSHEAREAERARALAAAPWADKLKHSDYTSELLKHATRIGHALRTKVYIAWMGRNLRLETRERRLELRPESNGVAAVFTEHNAEVRRRTIDLEGDAGLLAREWLGN